MLPDSTLQNHVAIITGGDTGIGKSIPLNLSKLGAKIVVARRKLENLNN